VSEREFAANAKEMAVTQLSSVVRFIHSIRKEDEPDRESDARLLSHFVRDRDEPAFARLVSRHGPMVMAVCKRILADHHLAEDAFQAVFLVLANKAASIKQRDNLSNWLYGVANRVAMKARTVRDSRRQGRPLSEPATPDSTGPIEWNDLRPVLDQEIGGLPDKYRVPFVLCYLQGKTNAAAAIELRCPEGTVVTRLARARARLRKRLSQRGVTLSIAALAAAMEECLSPIAISSEVALAGATGALMVGIDLATATRASQATRVSLAKGVVKAMVVSKIRTGAVVLFLTGLVAGGGITGYQRLAAGQRTEGLGSQETSQTTALPVSNAPQQPPPVMPNSVPLPPSVGIEPPRLNSTETEEKKPTQAMLSQEDPNSLRITAFYTPVFEGGAVGQPVPYSVEIKGLPLDEASKFMKRIAAILPNNNWERLSEDEKLEMILDRLAKLESRLSKPENKTP
jgi:RNA polymerase sigma factor (sigma-70 family)